MKHIEITYDLLLATLIVFTPLAFGSVHIWAFSLSEILSFTLFALWLVKIMICPGYMLERRLLPLAMASGAFIILALMTLVPFPRGIINAVSPSAHELYRQVIDGYASINTTEYITRALSIHPHLTLKSILKCLAYMAVFFSAAHELRDKYRLKRILLLIMFTGFAEAFYGLAMYFHSKLFIFGFERAPSIGAWGTYVNKNHFAGYVGMTTLISMGYLVAYTPLPENTRSTRRYISEFFKDPRAVVTCLLVLAVGLMALGISFSNSRMGIIALISSVVLMMSVLIASRRKRSGIMLFAVITAITLLLATYGTGHLEGRFDISFDHFKEHRLAIWENTLDLAKDYTLIGSGLGTFRSVFQLYTPEGWSSITKHAHNDYLELLSETGILGATIVGLALLYYIQIIIKLWRTSTINRKDMVSLGSFCAVFYILIFSISDFNLQIPANAYLFSISAAMSYACLAGISQKDMQKTNMDSVQTVRRAISACLLLFLVPLFLLAIGQWRSEHLFPVEKTFVRAGEPSKITSLPDMENAERAASFFPGNETYQILLGQYYVNEARDASTQNEMRLLLVKKAEERYRHALRLNASSVDTLGLLAWAEFSKGDFLSATRRLDTAMDIAPTNYFSHIFYAIAVTNFINVYPETMRRPYLYKASREFEKGLEMNPVFSRSPHVLINMANAFLKLGDTEEALIRFEMIKNYEPWTLPHIVKGARIHLDNGRPEEGTRRYRLMYSHFFKDMDSRRSIAAYLEEDVSSRPEIAELRTLLLKFLHELKEWDRAVRVLQEELGKGTRPDANIYYEMGMAYESGGDKANAKEMYIKAVKAENGHRKASKRLVELIRGEM